MEVPRINPSVTALVTGSRGFIGRHLVLRLRDQGWKVVDWEGDIRSIGSYEGAVDVVFHLAAVVQHDRFNSDPHGGYDTNVTGTLAALNYCRKSGARFIFASTSAVYQPPQPYALLSEDSPIGPTQPYALSKWLAESVCRQQWDDLEVPSIVLRIFNVYGPGQHPTFLVPYVVERLVQGSVVSLRMPEAIRDFICVDDVVDAVVRAGEKGGIGFEVFNIGSGQPTKVIDLVRIAEGLYGRAAAIDGGEPHPGEPSAIVADTSKARRELGWSPQFDLKKGLAAMMAPWQLKD